MLSDWRPADSLTQLCPAAELQPPLTAANQISTSYATRQTWLIGRQLRAAAQPSFQQFATQEGPAHCCCCCSWKADSTKKNVPIQIRVIYKSHAERVHCYWGRKWKCLICKEKSCLKVTCGWYSVFEIKNPKTFRWSVYLWGEQRRCSQSKCFLRACAHTRDGGVAASRAVCWVRTAVFRSENSSPPLTGSEEPTHCKILPPVCCTLWLEMNKKLSLKGSEPSRQSPQPLEHSRLGKSSLCIHWEP